MMAGRDTGPEGPADSQDERRWMVLLEATPGAEASPMDAEAAYALFKGIGDKDAVGLHCSDRVALQVEVPAVDPATALASAVCRWREAGSRLALEGWDVVRAEVLTPEEFERDLGAR